MVAPQATSALMPPAFANSSEGDVHALHAVDTPPGESTHNAFRPLPSAHRCTAALQLRMCEGSEGRKEGAEQVHSPGGPEHVLQFH
jgi:hypothetical protein